MAADPKQQTGEDEHPDPKQQTGEGEHPDPCAPADQPKLPADKCEDLPKPPTVPKIPEPKPCKFECECPEPPSATSNCLDELIAVENSLIKKAERAQSFKDELTALLDKTKAAQLEYTWDKYTALVKEWKRQDGQIVELIKKLVCAFPCWRCMVECVICVPIYAIRDLELKLNGRRIPFAPVDPIPTAADSLYDLRYWYERNRDARQAVFERIKKVLAAWEKPAQTIEKALADDDKIIKDASNVMAADAAKLLYDVFFILIPRHLAIAPPSDAADENTQTRIETQYAEFCPCDKDVPDACCGPDVGEMSLRERLVGPQPYLIAPDRYWDIVCCLVQKRYQPAKEALAQAESDFADADATVKSAAAAIDEQIKSLESAAKAKLLQYECKPSKDGDDDCACGPKSGGKSPAPAIS
jgi:hypothetical protein